jgi:GPH family glycoside/pentoside/hexuronide:cation symporter
MAIAFVLLWLPPVDGESAANGIWLVFVIQIYFFFVTIVGSPYSGILPELARRSEERVSLSAWQLGFGMVGAAIALVATGPIIQVLDFRVMAIAMASLGMVARYVGLLGVVGRLRYVPPEVRPSLIAALRTTFTNRHFLAFMPSLMGFNAAVLMLTQLIPFFVSAILEQTEAFVSVLAGTVMGVALAFAPLTVWLTNRFGKRRVYGWGLLAFACTLPLFSMAGFIPGVPKLLQTVVIISVIGLPLGAVFILPDAILSDITDYDERRSGTRREAMFFGTRATLEKMALAVATPLFAGLLDLFGSTHDDPLGIRLVGPVAAVLAFAGYVVFSVGYRLPDTRAGPPG